MKEFNFKFNFQFNQIENKYFFSNQVGDLHGCYDEMIDLLNLASKTTSKSRILKLFVGDLVNKGPKSKEIIDYFMNNGREDMLAVRGNHDELIIKLYMQYLKDKKLELNVETEWIKNLDSEHIDFLISLPYTISLPKLNSIIGQYIQIEFFFILFIVMFFFLFFFKKVHAGLIPGKQIEQNNWLDMTKMRNVVIEDYYDGAGVKGVDKPTTGDPWINTWKRDDLHVFFGHDALRGLQLSEYATGLDTGAVYGNKLSAVLINQNNLKKQFIEVKSKRKYCDPFKREPRIRNPSN